MELDPNFFLSIEKRGGVVWMIFVTLAGLKEEGEAKVAICYFFQKEIVRRGGGGKGGYY